ncbi:DUF4293 domain-containing protein [Olivibacter sitiensis]|uniref:DUF4293 domain-containing protein n=1 Tax=Olivibacter sitiensis TaxID=376470 RepID=UPI000407D5B4|nr:DUF4293 domain-containing protein [Olivibacter sitiensis]
MIQRIQTIWLLIASLLLFALFIFPFAKTGLSSQYFEVNVYGISKFEVDSGKITTTHGFSFIMMALYTLLIALLPLYTIFQYKNRPLQIKLAYVSIALSVLLAMWMYFATSSALNNVGMTLQISHMDLGTFLVPVHIVFLILAIQNIKRDIALIKSADRLR